MESPPEGGHRAGSRLAWGLDARETLSLLPLLLPVLAAGAATVIAAVWRSFEAPFSLSTIAGVGFLLAAAMFAEAYPVPVDRLPSGSVALAAVFILGAGIIYGWEAAVIVGFVTRAGLELAERRALVKLTYNSSVYALSGLAAGLATSPFALHEPAATRFLEVPWARPPSTW